MQRLIELAIKIGVFLLLCWSIRGQAQTPTPIPLTGNIAGITNGATPYAGVSIELANCPAPITIPGTAVIAPQGIQLQADGTGLINSTIWPTDKIDCNGTTGNSQYALQYIVNGVPTADPVCYQVVSTQGQWNLNVQQPVSCTQTPPNPQDQTIGNLVVTTTFTAPTSTIYQGKIVPKLTGITDWKDTTSACTVYRGEVNVLDCGAIADGHWQAGGCGQISPIGCWTGTDNYTAIHKANAAVSANGGGKLYFPPSGTNIWMVGSPSECLDTIGGSSSSTFFALSNGTEIKGSGKLVTTIMALRGDYTTTHCWIFGSATVPSYGIEIDNLRIDGNEATDSIHNDVLHPNNAGNSGSGSNSAAVGQLGAIFIQPGTEASPGQLNTPAVNLHDTQITGIPGVIVSSINIPNVSTFAIWTGPQGNVRVSHNDIYFNEWAGAIFTQSPDSVFDTNFINNDNLWTAGPQVVELETGTVRWVHNYWGGGFGANYVGLGVRNNIYASNINDAPGPGITAQCNAIIFGCGSNYVFYDGDLVFSQNNRIIGDTITDTYTGYPAVLIAGHTSNTTIINPNFNNSGTGNLPTYLVKEADSASGTTIIAPIINETPTVQNWSFLGSSSFVTGSVNVANDTPHNAPSYEVSGNSVLPSNLTGDHGNGTKVQLSDGTGISVPAAYDASGNLTATTPTGTGNSVRQTSPTLITPNIGVATATSIAIGANTVPVAGSPTVGNAACIKASGPPIVIGFCSTVPSAGGACTCN